MPLEVIQRPNKNELGQLSGALSVASQVYDLYKKIQANKYQKEKMPRLIGGLPQSAPAAEVEEEEKALMEVPEAITAPPGLEQFSKDLAAKLEEKRKMMGGKEGTGIDQPDVNTIFNAISGLPLTGNIPFAEMTDMIFKDFKNNWSPLAENMLSKILGSGISELTKDPRETLGENVGLSKEVRDIFFPEEIVKEPTSEWKQWLSENPGKGIEDYWKAKNPEGTPFDEEKFKQENPDFELSTQSSTGTRTWKKKADETKEANKLIPTHETIMSLSEDLSNPGNDYDTIMHNASLRYDLTNVDLPTKADQAKIAYDKFPAIMMGEEYIDEKGFIKDEEAYADYYKDYEKYAKKYFEETGEVLPKKFLSPEEAGKYTKNTWGTGEKGGYKPVVNDKGTPWNWQSETDATQEFYNELQRSGLKPEDYNLDELSREQGVDIEKIRKMINQGKTSKSGFNKKVSSAFYA